VTVTASREELPGSLAVVIAHENWLERRHRNVSGELTELVLFDPFAYAGTQLLTYQNIHFLGATLPHGQLAVSSCTTGECPGLSEPSEDARSTIFVSPDGGVSWEAGEELDGVFAIAGGRSAEELLLRRRSTEGAEVEGAFIWWPTRRGEAPPEEWDLEHGPYVLSALSVAWWTSDGRLIESDGSVLLDLNEELSGGATARGVSVLPNADTSRLAVTWVEVRPDDEVERWRWTIYSRDGSGYATDAILDAPFKMIPTAWIDANRLLVNGDLSWDALGESAPAGESGMVRLPLILDIGAATATAIDVTGEPRGIGLGWAVAVQVGPFAEINAGEGDCLNLRTEASTEGRALACIPHGALVERLSPLDGEWVQVRTADGRAGWVSGEWVQGAGSLRDD
jgi:hypothetical protein